MSSDEGVTPRFGAVDGLLDGPGVLDDPFSMDGLGIGRFKPKEPSVAPPPKASSATSSPKPRTKAVKALGTSFIFAGVDQDTRTLAPRLAKLAHRTLADLVLLGTQLELSYGIAEPDNNPGLPLGKVRAAASNLGDIQFRVSVAQKQWLEAAAKEAGAVSLRQFTGAALTAYVAQHRHELDGQ